jgi:hypothetical protein
MLSTFMERGTTQLHAALMNRRPIGNDINPLSIVLTRPRLAPPTLDEVARKLDQSRGDTGEIDDPELIVIVFYSPRTLRHICANRMFVMINQQKFTETANCWGVQEQCEGN